MPKCTQGVILSLVTRYMMPLYNDISSAEYSSSRIRKQKQFQYISFTSPVDYEILDFF